MKKKKAIAIVLGGGRGTRLYPLTMDRAKPAVPFAGKYRLVDIPISNCINSGIRQIYVLTQFNSASLHNHIANTYQFDQFSGGFVEILAAEQTYASESWYQGTADAVRKNLKHFHDQNADYYIIIAGVYGFEYVCHTPVAFHYFINRVSGFHPFEFATGNGRSYAPPRDKYKCCKLFHSLGITEPSRVSVVRFSRPFVRTFMVLRKPPKYPAGLKLIVITPFSSGLIGFLG